jgi:hypothetical protein
MKTPRYTLAIGLLLSMLLGLAACGSSSSRSLNSANPPPGGGVPPLPPPTGGGFPPPPPPPDPGPGQILIQGDVTFDKVPFGALGTGLDFAATDDTAPVRGATVELLDAATSAVLGVSQTSSTGEFAFAVARNTNVFVRVKAELLRATTPTWDFKVLDNTSGNALYAIESPAFNTGSVATLDIGNLHAASGWNLGTGSYDAPRSAAPFAILDIAYRNVGLVLTAAPATEFPALQLFWSPANDTDEGVGDPLVDYPAGDIIATFYESTEEAQNGIPAIYILGAADLDTDEFDDHVLAREWGKYFLDNFSRDDSVAGDHDFEISLDLTVAFSEAWANAFSGIESVDPIYRDSFDTGQSADFSFDMESNTLAVDDGGTPGWFNEGSLTSFIYDLFDAADDGETLQISFASLQTALQQMATTDALTSIYPFVRRLSVIESAVAPDIEALLAAQDVLPQPVADDFGSGETNDGGDVRNLPLYTDITINGGAQRLCTTGSTVRYYNALGNRRYLRLEVLGVAQDVTITVAGSAPNASGDPDVFIFRQGIELASDERLGGPAVLPNPDVIPVQPLTLEPGVYVIEAYDFRWIQFPPAAAGTRCFNVTVTSP